MIEEKRKSIREKIADTQPVRVVRRVIESINEMATPEFLNSAGVDLTRAHHRDQRNLNRGGQE